MKWLMWTISPVSNCLAVWSTTSTRSYPPTWAQTTNSSPSTMIGGVRKSPFFLQTLPVAETHEPVPRDPFQTDPDLAPVQAHVLGAMVVSGAGVVKEHLLPVHDHGGPPDDPVVPTALFSLGDECFIGKGMVPAKPVPVDDPVLFHVSTYLDAQHGGEAKVDPFVAEPFMLSTSGQRSLMGWNTVCRGDHFAMPGSSSGFHCQGLSSPISR